MSTLAIRVDDIIREKFRNATPQEQARWEEAFNLWWRIYFADDPKQKLDLAVNYFRQKSVERGLAPEELNEMLKDE